MDTVQCVLSLITERAIQEGGEPARRRLEKLNNLIGDPHRFVIPSTSCRLLIVENNRQPRFLLLMSLPR